MAHIDVHYPEEAELFDESPYGRHGCADCPFAQGVYFRRVDNGELGFVDCDKSREGVPFVVANCSIRGEV